MKSKQGRVGAKNVTVGGRPPKPICENSAVLASKVEADDGAFS